MATNESIAIRRTTALERVNAAVAKIADQTGVEIEAFPEPHKQQVLRPAIEAEWLADAFESIADTTKGKKGGKPTDAKVAAENKALSAQVENLQKENEAKDVRIKELESAESFSGELVSLDGPTPNELQRIFSAAEGNEALRTELIASGLLQAKQNEESKEWSFTWLNADGTPMGPDLLPEIDAAKDA